MKSITLDTNAYTALTNGDFAIKIVIENADSVFLPVIVIAELFYGFKNGSKERFNTELLQKFLNLSGVSIMHTSEKTAQIYAELCMGLRKKGRPIPTNDIWIAAFAIESDSTIITYDKHFLNIYGLKTWLGLS